MSTFFFLIFYKLNAFYLMSHVPDTEIQFLNVTYLLKIKTKFNIFKNNLQK